MADSMDARPLSNPPDGTGLPIRVSVSPEPVDGAVLAGLVASPSAGAVVLFLGTVRDHSPGKTGVTHLEYEAYCEAAEAEILEIAAEAGGRWNLAAVAAVHRLGSLEVGEASVGVAVAAAHRSEAFAAARYIIDELKQRAPIWKKEHWAGGAEWIGEGP